MQSFDRETTARSADVDATHEAQQPQGGGIARVQAVRAPGWEAVVEVAPQEPRQRVRPAGAGRAHEHEAAGAPRLLIVGAPHKAILFVR
jgi:hypothetical protein